MPQLLLVEGVRDGGVTNNSKRYIETDMKEKERGAVAGLLKCNSRVVHIFCEYFAYLYNYIQLFEFFYCLKLVWSQEFSAERAHKILTSLGVWNWSLNLIVL